MDDRGELVSKSGRPRWDTALATGRRMNHDTNKPHGSRPNAVGGRWYAIRRTSKWVNVWSLARDNQNVPDEVKDAATLKDSQQVNPHAWVQPQVNFSSSNTCDLDAAVQLQNIIINLNPCGHWADNAYPSSCTSTRVDHVNNDPGGRGHPAAFKDAYWDIASLTTLFPTTIGPSKRCHHSHKRNCF